MPVGIDETDVLVVGGGTAGSVAAIAAARNGAETLVVEQFGFLGGSASAALVTPMMPNHVDGKPLCAGISEEIQERLAAEGEAVLQGGTWWFNPEALKYVLEEMVLEAGARILYHACFSEPVLDGPRIAGAFFESVSKRIGISGKVVVDCTGDAAVAYRAGAPCVSGRAKDGANQAMSLRFLVGNVDLRRLAQFLNSLDPSAGASPPLIHVAMAWNRGDKLQLVFEEAVRDGVLRREDGEYFQAFSVPGRPNEMAFNCPRIHGNMRPTDALHLTQAQIEGKRAISRLLKFLRRYVPGFEESYLVATAPLLGIREGRRIVGEYVLTAEDCASARKFDDAVARNRYPVDIHLPGEKIGEPLPPGEYHEIPYRCLLPKGVENLLVAGRCISATFEAQSAIRVQPPVRMVGEAAGTAAALCAKLGTTPRKLSGTLLRSVLRENGAFL
ncbi:MAG: FAD-dependent oxidoreductase [Thermoproteota archaeon]